MSLDAGFLGGKPVFDPMRVHVGFVMDKVTLSRIFLRICDGQSDTWPYISQNFLGFLYQLPYILQVLCVLINLSYHRRSTDSVAK